MMFFVLEIRVTIVYKNLHKKIIPTIHLTKRDTRRFLKTIDKKIILSQILYDRVNVSNKLCVCGVYV